MSAPNKHKINLLPKEDFENSTLGKLLNWALSAGRVIVIITELVVIGAFLSRFWLDRKLTDLSEENTSRKIQVEAFASFEEEFKTTQSRLTAYKKLDETKKDTVTLLETTSSLLPAEVTLTSISRLKNQVTIKGISLSESGIAGFIKALTAQERFEKITLNDISLGPSQELIFSISLETKN